MNRNRRVERKYFGISPGHYFHFQLALMNAKVIQKALQNYQLMFITKNSQGNIHKMAPSMEFPMRISLYLFSKGISPRFSMGFDGV